ncbi:MAG TPA: hypothetical protein VHQ46_06235, partial [Desulfobacteria bacterium]|nr:hypothetical protein [Desulfobacteria bacterium]
NISSSNFYGLSSERLLKQVNRPVRQGQFLSGEGTVLEVVATEENRTRKTGLYRIEINDQNGEKLALAHGSVYLLEKTF